MGNGPKDPAETLKKVIAEIDNQDRVTMKEKKPKLESVLSRHPMLNKALSG